MKLTIDMADISTYDDYSVTEIIKDAVKDEIQKFVRGMAKQIMANSKKEIEKAVKVACHNDWIKVAELCRQIQGIVKEGE
jgi:uncharacterized protein YjbJ (UPF0337 family)